MPGGHIPFRGDGYSNVPRRIPLTEGQKSSARGFGCTLFIIGILLLYFAFTTGNEFIGFVTVLIALFSIIVYFAIRDGFGIATLASDDVQKDKKDPAMLDDYLAQIEWKQTYHYNHPKEPKWRFHPKLAKSNGTVWGWISITAAFMIVPIVLTYFFAVNSSVTIIGTVMLGFVGFFVYLIYQDSRD